MSEVVGFVGLGNQGGPIAERILRGGFGLTVWARRPEVLEEFVGSGATAAATLPELGEGCDLVAVCVFSDPDVVEVVDGLLVGMRAGSSIAIHSTVHPHTVRAVADAAARRNVTMLDAPVSGGNAGARAGTMAVMVGGDPEVVARWRPVFDTFAATVEQLGRVGAGQLAKLVNNALSSVLIGASSWALGAGEELGLDREALARVIEGSSGGNFMLRHAAALTPAGAGAAAVRLRKDLDLLAGVVGQPDAPHAFGEALTAIADSCVGHLEQLARTDGAS